MLPVPLERPIVMPLNPPVVKGAAVISLMDKDKLSEMLRGARVKDPAFPVKAAPALRAKRLAKRSTLPFPS